MERENSRLRSQLDDGYSKVGSALLDKHTTQQKGLTKVMADHEKLRKDYNKVKVFSGVTPQSFAINCKQPLQWLLVGRPTSCRR